MTKITSPLLTPASFSAPTRRPISFLPGDLILAMRALAALLLFLTLNAFVVADDPKPEPPTPAQGDDPKSKETAAHLKEMKGKWVGDSPEGMETKWEIKDDVVTVEIGELTFVSKIELDPTSKPHAAVDFKLTKPQEYEGKAVLGIYKVEKDKLTFCVALPDDPDRPTVFQTVDGKTFLYELRRPKKS